jgi:hypothetical protein
MDNNTGARMNGSSRDGNEEARDLRSGRFVMGLAAGAMLGVGIGLWLSPRAAGLRQWVDESSRELGTRASEEYARAGATVAAAAGGMATTVQTVRDGVADAVVRGAGEVTRLETAAKS